MTPRASILTHCASLAVLGLAGLSFAQNALTPVAAPAQRVVVIPFSTINVPDNQQWIAKGVQEDIIADFGRAGSYSPISFQGQIVVEDNATAARIAKNASAALAVRGAAQIVGGNVRLTAQLIDAKSGDTVTTASVTGPVNDLLKLEDELSAQLRGVNTAAAAAPASAPAPIVAAGAQPPVVPIVIQPPAAQPQIIVIQQPAPSYPDYGYGYGNPYYNWAYPVFYTTVIPPRNHDHDHDHFPDHHGDGHIPSPPPAGSGLPIPTNNVLPIPTNNILPIPTNNILPIPVRQLRPPASRPPMTPRNPVAPPVATPRNVVA